MACDSRTRAAVNRQLLYRRVFDFWLKIFALSFGMGVVSGIVMTFQFGTNWSVLAERTGSIQGPLLGYEAFTAFMLETTFFGVMLLGRERVSARFYFLACCMVSLGTMFSSFWILANNSWMQVPLGHTIVDGRIIPADWWAITTGPIMRLRWPHILLAGFLTTGMCVTATGAWFMLCGIHRAEARVMLHWGLGLVAVLIPIQLSFGHLTGTYILNYQRAKFSAIKARFFAFRVMVGMGLIMLAVSWFESFLRWRGRLERTRWFLWVAFLSFPSGVAVLARWFTAEVGRQPWVVNGLLRTKDAVTPSLRTGDVLLSLACFVIVYSIIYAFGLFFICRLLRAGPVGDASPPPKFTLARPLAVAMQGSTGGPQ
jgi:cytochrome d ubiquinol oxidase subunit I